MGMDLLCEFERWTEDRWVYLPVWESESGAPYDTDALSISRNYDFFGLLGRDYLSVAPIALQRGLPDDVTAEVRRIWERVKDDPAISNPSWVTLDELINYDWNINFRGSMHAVLAEEERSAKEAASDFLTRNLPYIRTLEENPRHLRIVFWFGC
ncbi:hypothetical protein [Deinococcus cavernae]|uniref:hypothetical protein n=1 Tax=Deinococcus cavernae TaxID=2320857 RepID=UPI0011C241C2|nr:hypothetical protein [Deinococcus cavernae]